LAGNLDDLNLDIHLDETLRERVDLDETGVDSAREATELGDQADIALRDGLVGVGADEAARNRSAETNAFTQVVD
jgi:hypothetical protein